MSNQTQILGKPMTNKEIKYENTTWLYDLWGQISQKHERTQNEPIALPSTQLPLTENLGLFGFLKQTHGRWPFLAGFACTQEIGHNGDS
ncbi:MAG: hypothetical protein GY841_19055 [FCB group bacterium]|nr:hypothetical protein [FCB group bacterium]